MVGFDPVLIMETKTCGRCQKSKPVDQFHRRAASRDGLAACCRACQYVYDLKRVNAPHRVKLRREYLETEHGQERSTAAKEAWAARNKEKRAAHVAVGNAIRNGKLEVGRRCNRCGTGSKRLQAHHDDYSKPLDVRWLCVPCHNTEHRHDRMTKKIAEYGITTQVKQ